MVLKIPKNVRSSVHKYKVHQLIRQLHVNQRFKYKKSCFFLKICRPAMYMSSSHPVKNPDQILDLLFIGFSCLKLLRQRALIHEDIRKYIFLFTAVSGTWLLTFYEFRRRNATKILFTCVWSSLHPWFLKVSHSVPSKV